MGGAQREQRLESLLARTVAETARGSAALESERLLIAIVSSRLGYDSALHRTACRFLCRSVFDCRSRRGSLLVALGSAIEPWATRAAQLFGVPLIRLSVDARDRNADILVEGDSVSRDAAVIALADRVDAVYVRRGGTIANNLLARLADRNDASTRVAVTRAPKCAAPRLIAAGAIGWVHASSRPERHHAGPSDLVQTDHGWTRTDGQWLVHCTRAPRGPWPGETERQFRDSILLGDESAADRDPLDALCRIIRSGRIVASATASTNDHPVVCFSAVPLAELLARRCFRPHLGRWDYEPYGVALRLSRARQLGVKPVIYGDPGLRRILASQDRYRFHPLGRTFDWTVEREWRSSESIELNQFVPHDVRVFAADDVDSRTALARCPWPVTYVSNAKA